MRVMPDTTAPCTRTYAQNTECTCTAVLELLTTNSDEPCTRSTQIHVHAVPTLKAMPVATMKGMHDRWISSVDTDGAHAGVAVLVKRSNAFDA
jgi:hypothetical protein